MATYTLTSPQTGREYDVEFDREPTQADVDGIWPQLDAHYATQEENKNVLFGVDTLSGIGQALGGLPTTASAAYYRMLEGDRRPDEYSPEARAAFDAANAYQARMQQESQDRIMRGEATSAGEAFREAAPSLGISAISMGANIGGRFVGKGVGAVAGLIAGAPTGPGAVGTAGLGGALGETAAGMAASYYVTQRIAKNQFLDDAFRLLGKERAQKGQPWGEQERQEAYQELLPLAEAAARWEAAPEALSNAITFGAGKYVLGIGKKTATDIARNVWKTLGKKTGAAVGSLAAESATETVTQLGQAPLQAQAQAYAQGRPGWQQEQGPYARPGGTLQAAADVLPATVATQALMFGMGAGVKGGASLLTSRRDAAAIPAPGQPMSQTGQPMSQPSPLAGIAARGGRVDVPPLLPEDTGSFTAAEARALTPRQPILTNVPDAVPTPPQTLTGSNVQTGTEMPVPPPTAAAGAGAGGISTPASPTPSTLATTTAPAPAPAATPEAGDVAGGVAKSSAAVSPSAPLTAAPAAVQTVTAMPVPPPTATADAGNGGVVEVSQRGDWLQAVFEGGTVSGRVLGNNLRISDENLSAEQRGKGYDTRMYQALVDEALKRGLNVQSASTVNEDTVRVYESLRRQGYQVQQNPQSFEVPGGSKALATGNDTNVFVITPTSTTPSTNPDVPQGAPGFRNLDTSGRTAGFLNTEILAEGAALIRRGVTDFTNWSLAMVQRFGAAIREFLGSIWQQIKPMAADALMNYMQRTGAVKMFDRGPEIEGGVARGGNVMLTVAPLRRDSMEEMNMKEVSKRASSAKFLHLQQITNDVANAYGVKVTSRQPLIGGWTENGVPSLEVPELVEFDTTDLDVAEEMAVVIAASAPELQNGALVWRDDPAGADIKMQFRAKGADQAMTIAKGLNEAGVKGFSYDPQTRKFSLVIIAVTEESLNHVQRYLQNQTAAGNISNGGIVETRSGTARLPEDSDYRRILQEAGSRADRLGAERGAALREVVSRAERRVERYEAARRISERAQEQLKKMARPRVSAHSIELSLRGRVFDNIRQLGLYIDSKFKALTGLSMFPIGSKEGIDFASKAFVYDILDGLATDGSGLGWYDERVQETIRELVKMHEEFATDANALAVYIGALASTSQGYTVTENFKHAERVYAAYKATGRLPTNLTFAKADGLINGNLRQMQEIIDRFGLDGYRDFMDKEITGSALRDQFGKLPTGVTLKDVVRGNRVLGPKIGSFFNNLRGRFDTITMDLWYTRTMHRYLGETLVPLDSPQMQKAIKTFRERLLDPKTTRLYGIDVNEALKSDEATVQAGLTLFQRWARGKNDYSEKGYFKFKDGYKIERAARRIFSIGGMKGAPQNKAHREYFAAVVRETKRKLAKLGFDLSEADIQAIIWYREKNLFARTGVANNAAKPADYLDAVMLVRGNQGFRNLDTSGRTAGFLNSEILAEGAALIRRGVTDFTSWSRSMVQRFGAAIREFLAGIWEQIISPQTNAAQNVRLGMPQGTAPVTVGAGGFVASPFHKAGTPFQVENFTLRTFLTSSPLPANLRGALDVTENERRAVDQQVAMISRDLQAAMTNAQKRTGQSEAAILGLVEQAMTGQPGAMVLLRQMDANLGERTRRARNILDDLSTAVAATLPVGPLSKTILANRGEWMQRGYAAFDPQSDWSYDKLVEKAKAGQMVGGKDPTQILADARNYLRTQQPGITPAELEATMRDLMDRNTWQQALITGTVRKQVGSLMQRKSIAPEIRALMGEETNVIHRLVKSASFQTQLIARHHGQVTMRTLGLATDLLRPQRGGVYTVQIPDEGYQWSGLGGLWTTPQLMEALHSTAGVLQESSTLGGWLVKTLKALGNEAKLNRVALNPDSWLVNVIGGMIASVQSGDVFSSSFIKRLREASRITGSSAARQNLSAQEALMDSYREMLTRLVSSGVVGSSITLADIEASIPRHLLQWVADNELRDRSVGMAQGAVIGQSMGRGLGLPGRTVGAALGGLGGAVAGAQNMQKWRQKVAEYVMTKPDNLFRVTGWLTNYESALAGGLTTDQAAEYASERTLNTFPNYNALPAPLREASKLGLMGSFIAFQHEVYRNFYWNVRYMAQELRSSNAAEQARGLRRLGGLVTIGSMTLGGGLAALLTGGGAVGADDERNRIYRRWFAAPWEKDAVLAFDAFTPETVSYFNTSYLLPQVTMQELAQAAMESEAPDEAVQRIMGRLWEQFAAGSVNLSPILNAVANQDRSGRPITNREGAAGVADRVDSAMQTILEPGVSDKLTRVIYALREAKRRGRAFSVEEEVKRAFAVRAQTREWEPMIKGVYARFASRYRNVREDANRVLGENLPGAPRRAVEEANTRITALQRELAEFELDLKRLPPTRQTILAAKKEAQMGNLNLVRVRKDGERVESVP